MVPALKDLTGKQTRSMFSQFEVSTGYICSARGEKRKRSQIITLRKMDGDNGSRSQFRGPESL